MYFIYFSIPSTKLLTVGLHTFNSFLVVYELLASLGLPVLCCSPDKKEACLLGCCQKLSRQIILYNDVIEGLFRVIIPGFLNPAFQKE